MRIQHKATPKGRWISRTESELQEPGPPPHQEVLLSRLNLEDRNLFLLKVVAPHLSAVAGSMVLL